MNKQFNKVSEHIQYCDNFFDEEILSSLHNKLYNCQSWGRTTSYETDTNFFWVCNLSMEDSVIKNETNHIQSMIPEKIIRIYVNGQTVHQHGTFHQDDGNKTYLLGLSKNWVVEDGGATEFLDKNSTSFLIYPLFNRLTIFDAKILHRALPHTNKDKFRMTLAIKT